MIAQESTVAQHPRLAGLDLRVALSFGLVSGRLSGPWAPGCRAGGVRFGWNLCVRL
jgi:hypothetical protein